MSSVIDNDDKNKQWAVVTVVLYSKDMFKLIKWKILYQTLENIFTKEVTDFMNIRLPILKG